MTHWPHSHRQSLLRLPFISCFTFNIVLNKHEQWKLGHYCKINHKRSSGAMEAAGASDIFCSSIANHKQICNDVTGDGDASSFKDTVDSKPNIEFCIIPNKLECIGHSQKWLGNHHRLVATLNTRNHLHIRPSTTIHSQPACSILLSHATSGHHLTSALSSHLAGHSFAFVYLICPFHLLSLQPFYIVMW